MARSLPYPVYDADYHLYESEEAMTAHVPKKWRSEFCYVDVGGRKKLAIGGTISEYVPNPTFRGARGAGPAREVVSRREHRGAHAARAHRQADLLPVRVPERRERIGASQVLLGSDYPHPEGLGEPLSFLDELSNLGAEDQQRIMSGNLKALLAPLQ